MNALVLTGLAGLAFHVAVIGSARVSPLMNGRVLGAVWSSGRPPECSVAALGGRMEAGVHNVWERAKSPQLRHYCDLVAGATSKLASNFSGNLSGKAFGGGGGGGRVVGGAAMAHAALDLAREADALLPDHAAPKVLEGRALALLGQKDEALAALREGKARDPGVLDEPATLLAWARAMARAGLLPDAVEAYRSLLPRAAALPGGDRAAATVEAGLAALALGPEALDDAIGALREAARDAEDDLAGAAVLGLALALDRRGAPEEARDLLARGRGDPRNVFETPRGKELADTVPWEIPAIAAFALESTDAAGAREAWRQYLEQNPSGPWAARAKERLSGTGGRRGTTSSRSRGR